MRASNFEVCDKEEQSPDGGHILLLVFRWSRR